MPDDRLDPFRSLTRRTKCQVDIRRLREHLHEGLERRVCIRHHTLDHNTVLRVHLGNTGQETGEQISRLTGLCIPLK